mgnify:CR=1 FL=1
MVAICTNIRTYISDNVIIFLNKYKYVKYLLKRNIKC